MGLRSGTYIWSKGHETEDDSWLWSSCEKRHNDYFPATVTFNYELLAINPWKSMYSKEANDDCLHDVMEIAIIADSPHVGELLETGCAIVHNGQFKSILTVLSLSSALCPAMEALERRRR